MSQEPGAPQQPTPPPPGPPPGPAPEPQYGQAPPPGGPPQPGQAPQHGQAPQYGQQPGYAAQPPGSYATPGFEPTTEMAPDQQRLWACLAHVSAIVSSLVGLTFLGPLVIFLVLKDRGVFIRRQTAEALNFQILVNVIGLALLLVTLITFGLGGLLYIPLGVVALVFVIIAAVKANQGIDHRYPVNWRLVK